MVAPYFWSCLFHGERAGIDYAVFKAALRQAGGGFGTGFLQVPAYMYAIFRNPNAYGNKGCPYNCHLYTGKVDWKAGLCPVAEDVIPRLVHTNVMVSLETVRESRGHLRRRSPWRRAARSQPLTYTDVDMRVLEVVKQGGQLEPIEVVAGLR